jgi:glycerol 2-dehydrogenase (NADP+)
MPSSMMLPTMIYNIVCDDQERGIDTPSWSTFHDRVEEGLDATLKSLKTDYLDLYLVHWPM